jgi:hypothetical protein
MRGFTLGSLVVGVVLVAGPGVAGGARFSNSVFVATQAGASVDRLVVPEPSGVIRLLRVIAPAGTRARVTGVMPGLAGVSISLPRARVDSAESCTRHGAAVACIQGEEACPMPAASWRFRVRKLAGPAGRIRIDFVVGPERSK